MPQPEPAPSTSKILIAVAIAGAGTALLILWLTLRPPPVPYRTPVAVLATGGIVIGVGIVIGGLVRIVEARFAKRYARAESAAAAHRQDITDQITALRHRQDQMMAMVGDLCQAIAELDDRAHRACKQAKLTGGKVDRVLGEMSVIAESIDELRGAYIEDGPPR